MQYFDDIVLKKEKDKSSEDKLHEVQKFLFSQYHLIDEAESNIPPFQEEFSFQQKGKN